MDENKAKSNEEFRDSAKALLKILDKELPGIICEMQDNALTLRGRLDSVRYLLEHDFSPEAEDAEE